MTNHLFARADRAMEEGFRLRELRQKLVAESDEMRAALRRQVFESATMRTEIQAFRDNQK